MNSADDRSTRSTSLRATVPVLSLSKEAKVEPVSSDPERSVQQVSAEGIQQILAELQKLNRRMDTLNTRLFGPRSFGARR